MSTERDTHFAGFAKALWDELMAVTNGYIDVSSDGMDDEWIEQYKAIIARRAYDLACSNVECVSETMAADISVGDLTVQECVNVYVYDLTEWPE